MTPFHTKAERMSALVVFLLLVTWVPAILLLLVQILLAGSFAISGTQKAAGTAPPITISTAAARIHFIIRRNSAVARCLSLVIC